MTTVTLPFSDIMSCMDLALYKSSPDFACLSGSTLLFVETDRVCWWDCMAQGLESSVAAILRGLMRTRLDKAGDWREGK